MKEMHLQKKALQNKKPLSMKIKSNFLSVIFCSLAFIIPAHAVAQRYTAIQLVESGLNYSQAFGINNAGQVVGLSGASGYKSALPTLWNNANAIALAVPDGINFGAAVAINDAGQIVGNMAGQSDWGSVSAFWSGSNEVATSLRSLSGSTAYSSASAINNKGQIVGTSELSSTEDKFPITLWENGQAKNLGSEVRYSASAYAINDSGLIAGEFHDVGNVPIPSGGIGFLVPHAAVWQGSHIVALKALGPDYDGSAANDVNEFGMVVGLSNKADGSGMHATMWHDGQSFDLGTAAGDTSTATAINNKNQIVGNYAINGGTWRGALWNGESFIDLNSMLDQSLIDEGWLFMAADINNDGVIVGNLYNLNDASASRAMKLIPIPEPAISSLMLLGLGLIVLAVATKPNQGPH